MCQEMKNWWKVGEDRLLPLGRYGTRRVEAPLIREFGIWRYNAAGTGCASEPSSFGARMTMIEIRRPANAMNAPTWKAVV
jgi:hypothetical protein